MGTLRRLSDSLFGLWMWLEGAPRVQLPPESIFVLRNNDLGDVLVCTPLFQALRERFPSSRLVVGVGPWSRELLSGNPWVDEIADVSAPWHNKVTTRHQAHSLQGILGAIEYLAFSPEVRALRKRGCGIGIDVLGSPQGSWLLIRAGIKYRIGMKGYADEAKACRQSVRFSQDEHVSKCLLRFALLFGDLPQLPEARPQLFLNAAEVQSAADRWGRVSAGERIKVVIQPGAGLPEKAWPIEHLVELCERMAQRKKYAMALVGSSRDKELASRIRQAAPEVVDFSGKLTLRETIGLISQADLVLSGPSMSTHVAAAFRRKSVVLAGRGTPDIDHYKKQWCYPETLCFGIAPGRNTIPTPDEVLTVLAENRYL